MLNYVDRDKSQSIPEHSFFFKKHCSTNERKVNSGCNRWLFLIWEFRFNCRKTYFEIGLLTAIYFHRSHGSRLDATEIALVLAK